MPDQAQNLRKKVNANKLSITIDKLKQLKHQNIYKDITKNKLPIIYSFFSLNGGVGKTLSVFSVVSFFCSMKIKTAVIDLNYPFSDISFYPIMDCRNIKFNFNKILSEKNILDEISETENVVISSTEKLEDININNVNYLIKYLSSLGFKAILFEIPTFMFDVYERVIDMTQISFFINSSEFTSIKNLFRFIKKKQINQEKIYYIVNKSNKKYLKKYKTFFEEMELKKEILNKTFYFMFDEKLNIVLDINKIDFNYILKSNYYRQWKNVIQVLFNIKNDRKKNVIEKIISKIYGN